MKRSEVRHRIDLYGLISHYGTDRARFCLRYLRKYLSHLYEKPKIQLYYDSEWMAFVKKIREELGEKFRKLYFLKNPVIIFLDDNYIGDHRALMQHITNKHGVIPNMPFPDLFPDFTRFLSKSRQKGYVYLDLRIGDLDDYVLGKMVFELHRNVVPETCEFFSYLCEQFGPYVFSEAKREPKLSYVGSTIRRICKGTFIQGGVIPEAKQLRVIDENFIVKHDRRGVISIANQGQNRSTTEFVISLKANPWMDGTNVAFGHLVFGESLLEAIEEIPTYYQSPLQDVVIVGCGVIPNSELKENIDYDLRILKMKQMNSKEVEANRKQKIKMVHQIEQKIQNILKKSQEERKCNVQLTESQVTSSTVGKESWDHVLPEDFEESFKEVGTEQIEGGLQTELFSTEEFSIDEEKLDLEVKDFTVREILHKAREKDRREKIKMMTDLFYSILQKVYNSTESLFKITDMEVREVEDIEDIHDAPSGIFKPDLYIKGLYSMPQCLKKMLVEAYNNLTPSKLKLVGVEVRNMLLEGGVPQESLSIYSSEDVMSGLFLSAINVVSEHESTNHKSISERFYTREDMEELVMELYEEAVESVQMRGADFIREVLADKSLSELEINA